MKEGNYALYISEFERHCVCNWHKGKKLSELLDKQLNVLMVEWITT